VWVYVCFTVVVVCGWIRACVCVCVVESVLLVWFYRLGKRVLQRVLQGVGC